MRIDELIVTEYLVQDGRKPIKLKRHNTKEGVKWSIWKGISLMLIPEGRWRYPDRRAIPLQWMYDTVEEALSHWEMFKDVEVWR